jgi:tRNA A37 threonylcarbamoyladenosine synthetase subunit TsaC/SUA5/YrdC
MRVYDFNEIDSICFEINNGKAAIIETDTVMGIVSKNSQLIYSVKKRSTKKKLVIFVPSIRDVPNLTPNQVSVLKEF